jgi:hypothetical protein
MKPWMEETGPAITESVHINCRILSRPSSSGLSRNNSLFITFKTPYKEPM